MCYNRKRERARAVRKRGRMKAKYGARDIANYFLWKAGQQGEFISNLKLQKLIYYAQGLSLVINDKPLFEDEIRAWSYGPVVPDLWAEYKQYGSNGIPPKSNFNCDTIDEEAREFLDEINEIFGQFSALRLMQISHSDQCWIDAHPNKVITHKAMRSTMAKYLKNGKES